MNLGEEVPNGWCFATSVMLQRLTKAAKTRRLSASRGACSTQYLTTDLFRKSLGAALEPFRASLVCNNSLCMVRIFGSARIDLPGSFRSG